MATHTSSLAWEIPWTEEPGGLQFIGSELDTNEHTHISRFVFFFEEFRAKHFLNISSNTHY